MPTFNHNGVNLYYEVRGDENSPHAVAFFNGVMATANSWYEISEIFEQKGFKVILHDYRGQMLSDKPDEPYTYAQHAKDAKALFEHLNCTGIHLVGTSYGGQIALRFAIDYPEATETLALIDSSSENDDVMKEFIISWRTLCEIGTGEQFFWGMAPTIYGLEYMRNNREFMRKRGAAMNTRVPKDYYEGQKRLYTTIAEDLNMTDELPQIQCPTLVLVGEEDLLTRPKFSDLLADRIPNTEYLKIPRSGHVAILEKPREITSVIYGFIAKQL